MTEEEYIQSKCYWHYWVIPRRTFSTGPQTDEVPTRDIDPNIYCLKCKIRKVDYDNPTKRPK